MGDAVNPRGPISSTKSWRGICSSAGVVSFREEKREAAEVRLLQHLGAGGSFQVDGLSLSPTRLSLPAPWGWYARSQGSHTQGI